MRILVMLSLFLNFSAYGDFKIPFKQFKLDNGLKVILIPQKTSEVACVQVFYNVGGIDEQEAYLGISHYLEHMMFKTSKNLKSGEYSYIIKSRGGYDNAYTSYDYTSYYNVLPVSELETSLKLESERMHLLTFDPKELNSERNVVIEELRNRYENSPIGYLWIKANEVFFKRHPYGRAVIGSEQSLNNITPEVIKRYYQEFYNPANSVLLVAGNIEIKSTLKLVQNYFGAIPGGHKAKKESYDFSQWAPQPGSQIFQKEGQTHYVMAFTKIPQLKHKLAPALMLLETILFKGNNSVINQRLVLEQKLCHNVNGGAYLRKLDSAMMFNFVPAEGAKIETIIQSYETELRKLTGRKDLAQMIEKAKQFNLTEFYSSLQKVKGLTETLGWGALMADDPEYQFKLYHQISKLKTKDIQQAVDFLIAQKHSVFILEPKK